VAGLKEAKARGLKVFGVVGRDGGYTKQVGDVVVVVPTVAESRVTPHAEAFQAVVWHCLVSHPALQQMATKW
jgi:D-sedoheptulose 7-phosphate isomerase